MQKTVIALCFLASAFSFVPDAFAADDPLPSASLPGDSVSGATASASPRAPRFSFSAAASGAGTQRVANKVCLVND